MRYITITIILLFTKSLRAHTPNEISYFLKLDSQELVVNLTPNTIVDLLKSIHPGLETAKTFHFKDYHSDIENYFNERITMQISGQRVTGKLIEANLTAHDASLHFQLENLPERMETYRIRLDSFQEIYKMGKNYVFLFANGQKHRYVLELGETEIRGNLKNAYNQVSFTGTKSIIIGLMMAILTMGFAFYRKNKVTIKPSANT